MTDREFLDMDGAEPDSKVRSGNFNGWWNILSQVSEHLIKQMRTTDRELLELAAKAAGLNDLTYFDEGAAGGKGMRRDELDWNNWNPLDDDGDALRLAVTLDIGVQHISKPGSHFGAEAWVGDDRHYAKRAIDASDFGAATRRAIVKAAAAIGRAM